LTANATGVFLAALETVFNLFVRNKETHRERKKKENVSVTIIKRTHTRKGNDKKKSNRGFDPLLSFQSRNEKIKREKKKNIILPSRARASRGARRVLALLAQGGSGGTGDGEHVL